MGKKLTTRERALRVLALRDHGEAELRRKLNTKGCPADEVDAVVSRLVEAGLIDDVALVEREVARLAERGYGPNAVRQRLRRRGFAGELVEGAIAGLVERDVFREACARTLERKFGGRLDPSDRKAWLKAARHLAGRGFREGTVRGALRNFERDYRG